MRKSMVVKIDGKEFTIKELTLKEIIELLQESKFIGDSQVGEGEQQTEKSMEEAMILKLQSLPGDFDKLLEKSCDFKVEDLFTLAPSEIKIITDGFKEVNSDFLAALKHLGVTEAIQAIKDVALIRFSKTLAGLLNQDI
jgi:hypothetical protein